MNRLDTPVIARAGGLWDGKTLPAGPDERPPGVLIVDDDAGIRELVAAGLRHHGFAVWVAAEGPEAVDHYRRSRFSIDVTLLDVMMPGYDGPRTLAALQEHDPAVRACFMTGFSGDYAEHDLLALGALTVFRKPFEIAELVHRLLDLITRPTPTATACTAAPQGPACGLLAPDPGGRL